MTGGEGATEARRWAGRLAALTGLAMAVYAARAFLVPGTVRFDPWALPDDARQFLAGVVAPAGATDLIARYWQAVTPPSFRLLYDAAGLLGLPPTLFARVLPLLLLPLAAWGAWRVGRRLTGRPPGAFAVAALTMAAVVHEDSVFSATPRAVVAPLFLLFVDGLLARRALPVLASLAAMALIYPAPAVVMLTMLGLSRITPHPFAIDWSHRSILLVGGATLAVALAVLPFRDQTAGWGPTLTLAEALRLPITALPDGRSTLVQADGSVGWLCSGRMGFLPEWVPCRQSGLDVGTAANLLLLAPLAWLGLRGFRRTGAERDRLFGWLLVASILWWSAAAATTFSLHLPSRWSARLLGLGEALALGALAGRWLEARARPWPRMVTPLIVVALAALFATPLAQVKRPADRAALARLAAMPPGTRIAGITPLLDAVPATTGLPVLAAAEHAIPYQLGYFRPLQAGLRRSAEMALTPDATRLAALLAADRIDVLAVDAGLATEPRLPRRPATVLGTAMALPPGRQPAWSRASRCVLHRGETVLLDAHCLGQVATR